jgi:hypothetical protein
MSTEPTVNTKATVLAGQEARHRLAFVRANGG